MSVRGNRHGILFLDFRYKGQRCRESTGLKDNPKNQKFASDWDAGIRHEIELGTFLYHDHFPNSPKHRTKPGLQTFQEYAESWIASNRHTWAEWTYRKNRDHIRIRINPRIGHLNVGEIQPAHVRQLREDLKGLGLANRTVNRAMAPVKTIFAELQGDGLIVRNPTARLRRLKESRSALIDPFGPKEIAAILEALPDLYRPYAQFLFASGFRLEEAIALKWSNVNFVTGIVSVREARTLGKDKETKTEAATRDVEILPGMLHALKQQEAISYLAYRNVFVGTKGQPLEVSNFRARIWTAALKKAKVRYRYPLQARHTFATRNLQAGADPLWTAYQMGTSVEMLYRNYTVYIPKRRPQTVDNSEFGQPFGQPPLSSKVED